MGGAGDDGACFWVFGYGSLIWRPAIPHRERRPAWIRGWGRRFWQGSTDHRGVPGAPGRVVTLIPREQERCWGMAYRVADRDRDEVIEVLDVREQGGYERREVAIHFHRNDAPPGSEETALLYVATAENRNYLGPESLERIARQVRGSHGPSGANLEYVLELARALREMDADDPHVFALEALLRGDPAGGAP